MLQVALPDRPMTQSGQSLTDTTLTTTIMSTSNITIIGVGNGQTKYQTGRLYQIEGEMDRYRLAILGISETRWKSNGKRKMSKGKLL